MNHEATEKNKRESKFLKIKESFKLENIIVLLISAYAVSSSSVLLLNSVTSKTAFDSVYFIQNHGIAFTGGLILILFAVLFGLTFKIKDFSKFKMLLFVSVAVYFSLICLFSFNEWFFLFLCIFVGVAAFYCFKDYSAEKLIRFEKIKPILPVSFFAAAVFVLTSFSSVFKYKAFASDNFDMGVYSQMFFSVLKNGQTNITCSSYAEASRFASAPAPILYLFAPFYAITKNMIPCLIIQSAIVASGLIPLYLICRQRKNSNAVTVISCFVYAFSSAIWQGVLYDFHEQSLLAPLVLWLLYFAEKDKILPVVILSLLTGAVGIDGITVLLFVGLYVLAGLKKRKSGISAVVISVICIITVFVFRKNIGIIGNSNFTDSFFIKNIIANPGYIFKRMLSAEKIMYLIILFVPLGFIPLISKKYSSYILLLPVFTALINTDLNVASVKYNHAFPCAVLLVYLFAVNFKEIKENIRPCITAFCMLAIVMSFAGTVLPGINVIGDYFENRARYTAIEQSLEKIPDSASVCADSRLTAHLANRESLYPWYRFEESEDSFYNSNSKYFAFESDYTVLTLYDGDIDYKNRLIEELKNSGFSVADYTDGVIIVLAKQESST